LEEQAISYFSFLNLKIISLIVLEQVIICSRIFYENLDINPNTTFFYLSREHW